MQHTLFQFPLYLNQGTPRQSFSIFLSKLELVFMNVCLLFYFKVVAF